MQLHGKYEEKIQTDTMLNDENVWQDFTQWYKQYLIYHVTKKLILKYRLDFLLRLSKQELNQLFFEEINNNLFKNDKFINKFTTVVNDYIVKWIDSIHINSLIEENKMENIVNILPIQGEIKRNYKIKEQEQQSYLNVMSNIIYQSILKALSNGEFINIEDKYCAEINASHLEGKIELKYKDEAEKKKLKKILTESSELIVDLLDILNHIYIENSLSSYDLVDVKFDELLSFRQLKRKIGGAGRRGGFERLQREKVQEVLYVIQNLFVKIDRVIVYNRAGKVQKSIKGNVFNFYDMQNDVYSLEYSTFQHVFKIKVGKIFHDYLSGSSRQIKLLHKKTITYHTHQKLLEKKLIRYISWRWRTQARNSNYLQSIKMKTLLNQINYTIKKLSPARFRDRVEKALDQLLEDGIVGNWQYEYWDENIVRKKFWIDDWLETKIIIFPPQIIISNYRMLEKSNKKFIENNLFTFQQLEDVEKEIGAKVKEKRLQKKLTLKQVADTLNISSSYLSHIERGFKTPSYQIYLRINEWLML